MSCSNKVQRVTTSLNVQNLLQCVSSVDVRDDVVGLPAILIAMLLTILLNFGLEDVSDVPVDGECPTSSQLD